MSPASPTDPQRPTDDADAAAGVAQSLQLLHAGRHREGAALAQRAAEQAEAAGQRHALAAARAASAQHLLRLGDPDQAIAQALPALQHFTEVNDLHQQSAAHSTLALAHDSVGLGQEALQHALAALETARACGDRSAECWALNRVGIAHRDDAHSRRGHQTLLQSLALAREIGGMDECYAALNNLSYGLLHLADRLAAQGMDTAELLAEGLVHASEALQLARTADNEYRVALALSNLGPLLARQGRVPEARAALDECEALAARNGYRGVELTAVVERATLDCETPQFVAAVTRLEALVLEFDAHTFPAQALRARRTLVDAHRRRGNPLSALDHLEHLLALELQVTAARSDLRARVLIHRVDLEEARHGAEIARLEGQMQRLRAEALDRTARDLAQHRDELEAQVLARTAELTEARDAAERANRAKTAFLANMSHELRTPLNGVLGMLEMALRRATDPVQRRQLNTSLGAGRHLRDLINDLLDLSAIEAGRLQLDDAEFALALVLDDVLAIAETAAMAKDLRLRAELDPALPAQARGDAVKLRQILLNLLGNAVKFSEHGEIVLRAQALPGGAGTHRLRFEVSDRGIGVSDAVRGRLFQPFAQGDDSPTRQHGGAGLGLAIARRLAQAMHGGVGLDSAPGGGTLAWVELELAAVPAAEPAAAAALGAEALAGRRVLVVEDNPVNLEVAGELLQMLGLQVETAADGQQAVQAVQRLDDLALVLMDVHMPQLDGLAATRAIRALPGREGLPIIAMTAGAFAEDRRACLQAGMNDHLAKPVLFEELQAMLLKWLR